MERWITDALLSMFCAGLTAVLAKQGMSGLTAEFGLTVRTLLVCLFVLMFSSVTVPVGAWRTLGLGNFFWLTLSAAATAGSWVFYYRALQVGTVSTVALIDKGSVLVAILLAWLFLGEAVTWKTAVGGVLILAGLLLIARK